MVQIAKKFAKSGAGTLHGAPEEAPYQLASVYKASPIAT